MLQLERRRSQRCPAEAEATYSWDDSSGIRRFGKGRLRNVSGGGLFVWCRHCPPKKARVQLSVAFWNIVDGKWLVLRASACVIRVECSEDGVPIGFALAMKSFALHSDLEKLDQFEPPISARMR